MVSSSMDFSCISPSKRSAWSQHLLSGSAGEVGLGFGARQALLADGPSARKTTLSANPKLAAAG